MTGPGKSEWCFRIWEAPRSYHDQLCSLVGLELLSLVVFCDAANHPLLLGLDQTKGEGRG